MGMRQVRFNGDGASTPIRDLAAEMVTENKCGHAAWGCGIYSLTGGRAQGNGEGATRPRCKQGIPQSLSLR
jgi:hypothetical protein